MNSPFVGKVLESNILRYIPREVCRGCKEIIDECEPSNPKKGQKRYEPDWDNPDPENCFTLCQDLRCERSTIGIKERREVYSEKVYITPPNASVAIRPIRGLGWRDSKERDIPWQEGDWQPNFKVMFYDPNDLSAPSGVQLKNPDGTNIPANAGGKLPDPVALKTYAVVDKGKLPLFPQAIFLTADFQKDGEGATQRDYNSKAAGHPEDFVAWLPNAFNEEPHLVYHGLIQIRFMRKIVATIELRKCRISFRVGDKGSGVFAKLSDTAHAKNLFGYSHLKKGEVHALQYKISCRSTVSGITYHFTSGSFITKWTLKVKTMLQAKDLFSMLLASLEMNAENWFHKNFGDQGGLGGTALRWGSAIGGKFWNDNKNKIFKRLKKWLLKKATKDVADKTADIIGRQTNFGWGTPGGGGGGSNSYQQSSEGGSGFYGEKSGESFKEKTTITSKSSPSGTVELGKSTKPSNYYINNITLEYDFYDFFQHNMRNPFEIFFDWSDQQYNALRNNVSAPVKQTLEVSGSNLSQIIRVGRIRADVDIFYGDYGNEYKNALSRGITFYSLKEMVMLFPQLSIRKKVNVSFAPGLVSNMDSTGGEENWREDIIDAPDQEPVKSPDDPNDSYGGVDGMDTYIEFQDGGAFEEFWAGFPWKGATRVGNKLSWGRALTGGSDWPNVIWNDGYPTPKEFKIPMSKGGGTDITYKLSNKEEPIVQTLPDEKYFITVWVKELKNNPFSCDFYLQITGGKITERTFEYTERKVDADINDYEQAAGVDNPTWDDGGMQEGDFQEQDAEGQEQMDTEEEGSFDSSNETSFESQDFNEDTQDQEDEDEDNLEDAQEDEDEDDEEQDQSQEKEDTQAKEDTQDQEKQDQGEQEQ